MEVGISAFDLLQQGIRFYDSPALSDLAGTGFEIVFEHNRLAFIRFSAIGFERIESQYDIRTTTIQFDTVVFVHLPYNPFVDHTHHRAERKNLRETNKLSYV